MTPACSWCGTVGPHGSSQCLEYLKAALGAANRADAEARAKLLVAVLALMSIASFGGGSKPDNDPTYDPSQDEPSSAASAREALKKIAETTR